MITEVKTDVRSFHNKFDILNPRRGRHSGILSVHTTLIVLLIAVIISKVAGIIW
ncbi:MAG: hypothetical protein OXE77_09675 [Flavobacteriaceae bacterium]|nr:hypothetical protein [Flavobacteriaceae bacterium]MCY4267769.1 hypothetical protein [Flavobacteriaceae bacterium]